MDFKDVAEGTCVASSTMYEISFDTFTRRVVCDKTTDPCGKAICQCDERKPFFKNTERFFNRSDTPFTDLVIKYETFH